MLTENDILEILRSYLVGKGYQVKQQLSTKQTGIDLIAENVDEILYVEAKGETSSKLETSRYGKIFNGAQIKSHISRAILSAFEVISGKSGNPKTQAAIALPDNEGHRKIVNKILPALHHSNIRVYLVSFDSVTEL